MVTAFQKDVRLLTPQRFHACRIPCVLPHGISEIVTFREGHP